MAKARKGRASETAGSSPLKVWVAMGSDSDYPVMEEAVKVLKEFGIPYEVDITSAHRTPDVTADLARNAEQRGFGAIILGAGHAAHLAGVVAAHTTLPVIGVPLATSALNGVDALHSVVQMPSGVPVACVAVNGAANAAYLAAQVLGLRHESIREAYERVRKELAEGA